MEIRKLLDDDSAVSPVIGVILMVAITVILAAVIATFVLGLGESISQTAPQSSFSFDYEEGGSDGESFDGLLSVVHDGGDSIEAQNLYIRGTPNGDDDGAWSSSSIESSSYSTTEMISAGTGVDVDVNSESTIRVVYQSSGGGNSATLGRWDGPDA